MPSPLETDICRGLVIDSIVVKSIDKVFHMMILKWNIINNCTITCMSVIRPSIYTRGRVQLEYDWKSELILIQSRVDANEVQAANYDNVTRDRVMECAKRAFKRKAFCPLKPISVAFVDAYNISEGVVDNGGPTREFFRLLVKEATASHFSMVHLELVLWLCQLRVRNFNFISPYTGSRYCTQLALFCKTCYLDALSNRTYREAGMFIALSLIHGGPGPMCFSEALYQRLSGSPLTCQLTVDDIQDTLVQDVLKKIKSLADRDLLVEDAVTFYLFGRVQAALDQFKEGLETGGILPAIRKHPDGFRCVFVKPEERHDHTTLQEMFAPSLSPRGSNRRNIENRIISLWRDWLIDIEEGESNVTFEQLLIFATACDVIPPLGFHPAPSLEVTHDGSAYLTANTRSLVLRLPVHSNFDTWKTRMETGILESPTFGLS
ncbi:putative G2/M phase-specific E3 ubiquitin-protein ligase-like [Apostichopus japonicus]|uniref:Putative G2/M phase-specific E3 ubiquitin-protein ligase-like n=1 Tax=Stichopus japonicus TaxID=307972 RepID=A0A2G8JCW9_STIJA|nr:putative G2/M phase-specific E3 ubiquitin-protein ligase-like [Apostichopus japonicus]